eukprot:scpid83656/ scgid12784/ Beta-sarcoglycan
MFRTNSRSRSGRHRQSMSKKSLHNSLSKSGHRTNFDAGQAPLDLHTLTRVGLRGRKAWLVIALFIFVGLLVIAELIWTCLILAMLRVDTRGVPSLQFLEDGGLRFSKPTDGGDMIAGGFVGAFQDSDISLNGADSQSSQADASVSFLSDHGSINKKPQRSELSVSQRSGIVISSADRFDASADTRAVDGTSVRESYWSVTKSSVRIPTPDRAARLTARMIITPRLNSMPDGNLMVTSESGQSIDVSSIAGLSVHGRQIRMNSGGGDIALQAARSMSIESNGTLTVNTSSWKTNAANTASGSSTPTPVSGGQQQQQQ